MHKFLQAIFVSALFLPLSLTSSANVETKVEKKISQKTVQKRDDKTTSKQKKEVKEAKLKVKKEVGVEKKLTSTDSKTESEIDLPKKIPDDKQAISEKKEPEAKVEPQVELNTQNSKQENKPNEAIEVAEGSLSKESGELEQENNTYYDLAELQARNIELYEEYRFEKEEKEQQQKLLLDRLQQYIAQYVEDIEYLPTGYPFTQNGVFILDNMLFETEVGSVQVFKEGYLNSLLSRYQYRFVTFTDLKGKPELQELTKEIKENQIASFLFDQHANIRLFFEKLRRANQPSPKLLTEINRMRAVILDLDKLSADKEAINNFLQNFDFLEDARLEQQREMLKLKQNKDVEVE